MTTCPQVIAIASTLAALAAAPAFAQTGSVQVFGIVDAAVEISSTGAPGAKSMKNLNSGNLSGSRFGFRGTEDLGGGLKATFHVESNLLVDTGATPGMPDEPTSFWVRRSVVGLQGGFGELLLGRDLTPAFRTLLMTDRFRMGLPANLNGPTLTAFSRASNGLFYSTPSFGGVTGRFAATAGAERSSAPTDLGRIESAALDYRQGKLFVSAAIQRRRDATPGNPTSSTRYQDGGVGAEYRAGDWTTSIGAWLTDPVTATAGAVTKSKAAWLGVSRTFGLSEVAFQLVRTNVDVVGRGDGTALTYGLKYEYRLSKRTTLYASLGGVNNDDNTRLAINTGTVRTGGAVFGADPTAKLAGVSHSF